MTPIEHAKEYVAGMNRYRDKKIAANQPAIPLDDLPRPGVAISRERWIDLIAKEQRLAELYTADPERNAEIEELSRLVQNLLAARARIAELERAGNELERIVNVAANTNPDTWPTDAELDAATAQWHAAMGKEDKP